MERNSKFNDVSPDVGEIDQSAFEDLLAEDPEQALELLAEMAGATDRELARLARRLAGRLVLDLTRVGRARGRGVGKLVRAPATVDGGDLDVDASLDRLVTARAERRPPDMSELVTTAWRRPATAICLVVDRSGSMNGERLVAAAMAAAVCSWRAPADFAVLAFGDRVLSIKDLTDPKPPDRVVGEVLTLRGRGTTDVELALRAAGRQLAGSRASRKLTILLSDADATVGGDPVPAARSLDELAILAPEDGPEAARSLARAGGARLAEVAGPLSVLDALRAVVE